MLQSKKAVTLTAFLITGLLFLTNPLLADSKMENCGKKSYNKAELTDEQLNKIEKIEEQFEKNIIPLRQELNTLRTEAYNYTLNENLDIYKIKSFRKQIREIQGEIDDKRLDVVAEINNILPEDQREDFSNYFSRCGNKDNMMDNHSMMNGECMMKENSKMDEDGMMKMCMNMMDKMHGEGGMMEGNMMNHGMIKSDSTGSSMMKDNTMKMDSTKSMKKSEHEQHHK